MKKKTVKKSKKVGSNTENSTLLENGLTLCCLCGKHKEDSKCEVFLRNTGKWVEQGKDGGLTELEELKKFIETLKREFPGDPKTVPNLPKMPYPPTSTRYCPFCGVYYQGDWHYCHKTVWYS